MSSPLTPTLPPTAQIPTHCPTPTTATRPSPSPPFLRLSVPISRRTGHESQLRNHPPNSPRHRECLLTCFSPFVPETSVLTALVISPIAKSPVLGAGTDRDDGTTMGSASLTAQNSLYPVEFGERTGARPFPAFILNIQQVFPYPGFRKRLELAPPHAFMVRGDRTGNIPDVALRTKTKMNETSTRGTTSA